MTTTYYKATRPDGRDFRTGTIDYGTALVTGEIVQHPATKLVAGDPWTYLSVATVPTDCTGVRWPCRLFAVEPVGRVYEPAVTGLPNKRCVRALRVVAELPPHDVFGPQGEQVVAIIERVGRLTPDEVNRLATAWDAARDAARAAAWAAARAAARAAAWDVARDVARAVPWAVAREAAWDAALALLTRDLITPEQYTLLTGPWETATGATP